MTAVYLHARAQVENGEHTRRRLALAEARQGELEAELRQARQAADEAELRAHAERVRACRLVWHGCTHACQQLRLLASPRQVHISASQFEP